MSSRQAAAHIDLEAIAHNFDTVKQLAPSSRVMAVIKADAYGHGAVQVARKLEAADALGVARVSEAVKLREKGIGTPICLLEGVVDREELNLASVYELQVVVHDDEQLALLEHNGARRNIWLKVDTGMGRLGFKPEAVPDILERIGRQKLLGIMTHLANADDLQSTKTNEQISCIRNFVERTDHPACKVISIANSAGILHHPESISDWIRPGLMLYGASPMTSLKPIDKLHPAMTFSAPVIAVRELKQGETVGYGGIWCAGKDTRVAVIAAGYADGYPREIDPGTPVLLGGARRPVVGRVSMDMICVELEETDATKPGDRAILWGQGLPVEEIARASGTIAYTLLCGVSHRVSRHYRGEARHGSDLHGDRRG